MKLLLLLLITMISTSASANQMILANMITSPEVSKFLNGLAKKYDMTFTETEVGDLKTFKLKISIYNTTAHGSPRTCSVDYTKEVKTNEIDVAQTTLPMKLSPIYCEF